jgi:hypothetical protein
MASFGLIQSHWQEHFNMILAPIAILEITSKRIGLHLLSRRTGKPFLLLGKASRAIRKRFARSLRIRNLAPSSTLKPLLQIGSN